MNSFTKHFTLTNKLLNPTHTSFLKKLFLRAFAASSLLVATNATAQKQPLNHDVYDDWQSFGSVNISPDGKWSIYNVNPQEGDSWLYIQATQQQTPKQKIHRAEKASITANSKYIVFSIKPFYKEIKQNRVQKNKKDDKNKEEKKLTKDTLGIYNLANHQLIKIPEVLNFKLPEKNGDYVAYLREVEKESKDTIKSKKKETFKKLVLRDLKNDKEVSFDNAEHYIFSENGDYLAYTIKNEKKKNEKKEEKTTENETAEVEKLEAVSNEKEGVYLVRTKDMQEIAITDKDGVYSKLKFNKNSNLLAFIATHDKEKEEIKKYSVNLFKTDNQELLRFDNDLNGIPTDWVISENYTPEFSENSKSLYLGIAPKKEAKDTTFIEEDHAILDIWHYKDEYLQTQQLVNLKRELEKSYLSVVHLDHPNRLIPLQDEKMNYVRLVNEGNADFVFGMSDYGNRIEKQWQSSGMSSYYTIDTKTGSKKEVLKNLRGNVSISPEGKNLVFFDRESSNWYTYDIASGNVRHLNKNINVSFANEQHDSPDLASPYSLIGWTKDDASVWIKDRYDIWEFDLKTNQAPKNMTHAYGRENKISFNYLKLDKEARHIDTDKKMILTAFQENDKQSGFYELYSKQNRKPKKIYMEAMSGHRSLIKAEESEDYLFTHQSFIIPPTLVSTKNLKNFTALHQTNPQQKDYNWGTVELIHYTAQNGKPATGMLYKPEDFDANKKYPLLSYFYERRSDDLHGYEAPAPTPSRLNITYFVSNGYLVFVPDIEYTEGYPGRSAEEYVDAGIDYLKTFDFVNGDKIGIQGQSWGGYQVAHLITRSNRYAAAWAGAPVVNMTSAYGGIRWSTGMNRQFQYEKTQSRIGKNLWDGYDLYIENSPLFHLENVNTPVAIMHNDKDGAVPWYQGIEMFTALRRLGKPVWMLNYNNDEHNLIKRQNRKDIQRREQQFFDHYLKDAPAPAWMVHGIPATQKGKTWGFELIDETP